MSDKAIGLCVHVKSVNDEQRYIEGIATTPRVDRSGDIVEPLGAKFEREIPLLLDHKAQLRVGRVELGKPTKDGIPFKAWLPKVTEPGALQERVELAWQELKYGLLKFVSIGFRVLNDAVEYLRETGGIRFKETEILELSLVPIPAQPDARISFFKSCSLPAASGQSNRPRQGTQPKGKTMKQYTQEALAALQNDRQTKAARMAEIFEAGLTDETRGEFVELKGEIARLDDEIAVTEVHVTNIAKAKPVDVGANEGRGAPHIRKFNDLDPKFKGEEGLKRAVAHIESMRLLKAGEIVTPAQIAERMWGKTNPTLVEVMKTGVAGGSSLSGGWGAELVQADTRYTGDFVEYLYGETVFDKLPLRAVPHNVVIKGQDGAFTGYFVGQHMPIKVSKGDYSTTSTTPYKAAGLTVVSNEWLRDSSPDGLALVGDGLRKAVAAAVDTLFLSATAASSNVSPAGILNGTSAINSNGGDAQSIATDVKALFAPFITAKNTAGGFVWVMTPTTALALSLMRNALGQPEYPTITPNGGTFQGYPVVTGDNMGTTDIILIKPSDVWKIGDLGVTLSISTEAMIEQDDAPTGETKTPTAASASMVSMFQDESTAIKVVRPISWGKRRAGCAQYITDASYGAEQS